MRILALFTLFAVASIADAGPFRQRFSRDCSSGSCQTTQTVTQTKTTTTTTIKQSIICKTYAEARTHCKKHRQRIIIFVGVKTKVRPVRGCVSVSVDKLDGYPASCVVVGTADLEWVATLDEGADDAAIDAVGSPVAANDALDEVNAQRAARGLRPYIRDEGLTQAAQAAAEYRAARGIRGHTSNDFGFLPAGSDSPAAGCGALEPSWGFQSCCMYDNRTYAGAASVPGNDGRIYHHLYVR